MGVEYFIVRDIASQVTRKHEYNSSRCAKCHKKTDDLINYMCEKCYNKFGYHKLSK